MAGSGARLLLKAAEQGWDPRERVLSYFDTGCLPPPAAHAPHHLHKGRHKPLGHFEGSWEDQRHSNSSGKGA